MPKSYSSGFSPVQKQYNYNDYSGYSPISAAQDQSVNGSAFSDQAYVPGDLKFDKPGLAPRVFNVSIFEGCSFIDGKAESSGFSWGAAIGTLFGKFANFGLDAIASRWLKSTLPDLSTYANYTGAGTGAWAGTTPAASRTGFFIDTVNPGYVVQGAPATTTTTTATTTAGTTGTTTAGTTGTTTAGTTGTTTNTNNNTNNNGNGTGTVISANDFNNAIDDLASDGKTQKLYYGVAQNKDHDYEKTISKHGSGVSEADQKKGIRAGKAKDADGQETKTKTTEGYYQYITLTDGTSGNEYTYTFKSAKDGKLTYKLSKNDSDVTHDDGKQKDYSLTGAEPEVVISIKDGAIYLESSGLAYSSTAKGKHFTA